MRAGTGKTILRDHTADRSRRVGRNRIRVLAVDDDPQTLRYVRDALSGAGLTPIVTGDPEQVDRLMDEEKSHLVLPGVDGAELMKTLPQLADVPVIFLSAYGRDQTIARAWRRGRSTTSSSPSPRRSWWRESTRP